MACDSRKSCTGQQKESKRCKLWVILFYGLISYNSWFYSPSNHKVARDGRLVTRMRSSAFWILLSCLYSQKSFGGDKKVPSVMLDPNLLFQPAWEMSSSWRPHGYESGSQDGRRVGWRTSHWWILDLLTPRNREVNPARYKEKGKSCSYVDYNFWQWRSIRWFPTLVQRYLPPKIDSFPGIIVHPQEKEGILRI